MEKVFFNFGKSFKNSRHLEISSLESLRHLIKAKQGRKDTKLSQGVFGYDITGSDFKRICDNGYKPFVGSYDEFLKKYIQ